MSANAQLTLSQILSAILRHKLKSLLVFTLVMMMVVVLFVVWPRKYGSEGRLYVQRGGNSQGISPIVTNSGVMVQDSHETEIRSVVEIIKSRAVVETVVDEIGAEEILKSPFDDLLPEISLSSFFKKSSGSKVKGISAEDYDELKRREAAVEILQNSLVVYTEKQTSVISVFAKGNSPELAKRLVQSVFDETRRIYMSVHSVKGSAEFFEEQVEQAENRFTLSLKAQESFRNKEGILSVYAARGTLDKIVSELEQQIISAEVEVDSTGKKVDSLSQDFKTIKQSVAVPTEGVEDESFERAQELLFNAEDQLAGLRLQLSPSHPRVVQQEERLRVLRASTAKLQQSSRVESELQLNPTYEKMKVELATAKAGFHAAKARLKSLNEKYNFHRKRQKEMNSLEVQSQQLSNNVDTARQEWELFKNKGIEAMASGKLDESQLSSVVVIQAPNWVVKPISPKASMFLPLGAVMGVLAGLGVALFFERNHLSASLNEGEVEQILEMPVLVTLPRVYSSRNMVN